MDTVIIYAEHVKLKDELFPSYKIWTCIDIRLEESNLPVYKAVFCMKQDNIYFP